MKKRKYIIVLISFLVIIISIIIFFVNKNEKTILRNKVNYILKTVYSISSGEYDFENGSISTPRSFFTNDKYDIKGKGKIYSDKYKNVKLYINTKKYCISKTSLGDVKIERGKCKDFDNIYVEFAKNNNKVSFLTNLSSSEYMISSKDNFKGTWIQNNSSNLVLNTYDEGDNYIWFKDKNGNISDVINYSIDCLHANDSKYDKGVFYCSGSKVILDKNEWIVIKDNYNEITLISENPIKEKLSHSVNNDVNYTFNSKNIYNWSNSYINNYLNHVYLYTLSNNTINSIKEKEICIDYNSKCDNELCIGNLKDEIKVNDYKCNNYTKSKVRLISYEEYNYLYENVNKNIVGSNVWMINSYITNKGAIIDSNDDVYTNEELNEYNYIKPVITLVK